MRFIEFALITWVGLAILFLFFWYALVGPGHPCDDCMVTDCGECVHYEKDIGKS